MSRTPYNPRFGQIIKNDAGGSADWDFIAHMQYSAVQAATASTTGVHAAVTDTGVQVDVSTAITSPPCPRNITATAGGVAGDVKAIQVIITGTNEADEAITETLPAFTVDVLGSVVGNKAFKTVTNIRIPAHDGNGATTACGFGDKLGLGFELAHNTVLATYLNNAKEANAPTIALSADLESNTIDLDSALNGTVVDAYLIV